MNTVYFIINSSTMERLSLSQLLYYSHSLKYSILLKSQKKVILNDKGLLMDTCGKHHRIYPSKIYMSLTFTICFLFERENGEEFLMRLRESRILLIVINLQE